MALTIRQVRHFIATAETGRVLSAAAGLNVTQSAVTASLKALEAEVGRKLFDRHSNGVTLTFDGQQFLQRARAIEAALQMRCGAHIAGEPRLMARWTLPSAIPWPAIPPARVGNGPTVMVMLPREW